MAEPVTQQRFLTVRQAAEEAQVSVMTIHRLIQRGELTALRVGRSIRIERASWDAYLQGARL